MTRIKLTRECIENLIQIEHPHKKIKWDDNGNAYLDTETAETGENTHAADKVEVQEAPKKKKVSLRGGRVDD